MSDDLTAVVHEDPTQDHLSAQADESVVEEAAARLKDQQDEHFDYEAAAAEVAAEPSETAPTVSFGSPEGEGAE